MQNAVPFHPEVNAIVESFAKIEAQHQAFARRIAETLRPHQAIIDRIAEQEAVFQRMAEKFNPMMERIRELDEASRFHQKLKNADTTLGILRQLTDAQAAFEIAFKPIRELSAVLERIQTYHVPSVTLFAPDTAAVVAHIAKGSGYHSATYRGFFKIKKAEVAVVAEVQSLPPSTASLPSRETFLAGQSAVAAQSDLRDLFPAKLKPEGQNPDLVAELDELFAREIANLDQALTKMLVGAKQAMGSNNPDSLRQVSTSLREFLKVFLTSIAPDASFHVWAQRQNLSEKEIKKLETRIRFVARNAPSTAELSFYQVDAAQLRLLINHFNEGVHWKTARFGKNDLPALVRRVEGFVATLIEIDRAYNR